jgi:ABC-type transport system involved in multi-copper enzyme maturation permease subunit
MISTVLISREFRVSSKQKRIYILRVIAAVVLWLFVMIGLLVEVSSGSPGSGGKLFASLSFLLFTFVSIFILSQSCGSITDERNQGTLGLLLLTPLTSFDVVIGKFTARCGEGFQLVLVALPLIFVPYALGGFTGAQLLSSFVVTLAQILLCASLGVLTSSLFKQTSSAFVMAVIVMFVFEITGVVLVQMSSVLSINLTHPLLTFVNPMAAMFRQFSIQPGDFAWSFATLGFAIGLSLVALVIASMKVKAIVTASGELGQKWSFFPKVRRKRKSKCRADERAPIYWLEWGHLNSKRNLFLIMAMICSLAAIWVYESTNIGIIFFFVGSGVVFLLQMLMLVSIVRSIYIQKHERVLELLLSTPLRSHDWLNQQIKARWSAFGIPLILISIPSAAGYWIMSGKEAVGWSSLILAGMSLLTILSTLSNWYMLVILSISFGLSSKAMGNALGIVILIYFATGMFSSCLFFVPPLVIGYLLHRGLKQKLRARIFEQR